MSQFGEQLPGVKIVPASKIKSRGRTMGYSAYLIASLTLPQDRALTIDYKEINPKNPAKAASTAQGSLRARIHRRNLRDHLHVAYSETETPHVVSIMRLSNRRWTEQEAEKIVTGPITESRKLLE